MNLDEFQDEEVTHVIVYGPPKSGKTALAAELARYGYRLHWLDLENGRKTLRNPTILPPEFRKNIDIANIPDHQNYPIAIQTVKQIFKDPTPKKVCFAHGAIGCIHCSKDPNAKFTTIELPKFTRRDVLVLDSLTQLGQSAINYAVKKELEKQGENYKFEWDDYRVQGYALDNVCGKIQVAPLNVIVLSHEIDTEKDDKSPERLAPVAGTRNHSKTVAKNFDEVVYTFIQNGAHKVANSTTFKPNVQTGGRTGVQLDKLPKPSLLPLFRPEAYEVLMAGKEFKIDWEKEGL